MLPIDDADAALYTIGQVAEMLDARVTFLRRLDEQGVVVPARSAGGQRRYSRREISQVAEAMKLIDEGLTLAGVRRVLALKAHIRGLEAELAARDAVVERGRLPADQQRPG
ncbi:MerR family transcriptional regulator [Streptomyces sp. ISL-98]|uniref:MerR family transcriptional regulator n=1 Tax=Streptomyces sp. ISL-98 TaxID=2819192 RepID=UPI001BE9512D|nr:MerR family transcriptional regulator [Streptomyces sp. ISL-98]MBT2507761.1 MerR family transcriptional regulator [Streptomyces sp. ISL-98]